MVQLQGSEGDRLVIEPQDVCRIVEEGGTYLVVRTCLGIDGQSDNERM